MKLAKNRFTYGKDITHKVTFLDGNGVEITPSDDAPNIYLFDAFPSRNVAIAGTGALDSGSWTGSGSTRAIAFDAVTDPDPNSATHFKEYWIAINFTAEASGQSQCVVEKIRIERTWTQDPRLSIAAQDAKDVYPAISSYLSDDQITQYLIGAIDDLKTDLEAKGVEWQTVCNATKFKRAAIFRAIADASLSQHREQGDKFEKRYVEYSKKYEIQLTAINVIVDDDGDGEPEEIKEARPSYFIAYR